MIIDFINLHKVFYILGTLNGDLIKKSFELILFTLITYMLVSEYTRDRRRDLRYTIAAFGALAFSKLVSATVLAGVLFGRLGPTTYILYFPVIDHFMEIVAIILLINAFLFPILVKTRKSIKRSMIIEILLSGIIFSIFVSSLIVELVVFKINGINTNFWCSLICTMIKMLLLLYAIYTLSIRTDIIYKYRYSIIISFLVYTVAPLFKLMNILFYEGINQRIIVASHPFPLIAVFLFTRVIYLKLVDKAFLKKKLKLSEEKYEHEKELNRIKDKFVSVVSHELRTPLTSINLYISLLNEGKFGDITKKQEEAITIIKTESKRLTNLVNDILDLSRLEAKKIDLKISDFNLYDFYKEIPLFIFAKNKGIKMINKIPKDFSIKVDSERFKQVIINLVSNALKYTDKGSVTISAEEKKEFYQVDVSDTGRGIPKEEQTKIFDKFYQIEHYLKREQGFGLGLSIVSEIVKAHKGEIKIDSEVGKGTTFSIIIPKSL